MRRVAQLAAVIFLLSGCGGSEASVQSTASPSPSHPGPLGDTWAWDGAGWHRAAVSGPSPRYLAAMAYDAKRRVYVLYGGHTAKGFSDETWTWDGKAWNMLSPAHKPGTRLSFALAYDPAHELIVLYGGDLAVRGSEEGKSIGDTWTWDGSDWTEVDVGPGAPGKRYGANLITAGGKVILFGGNEYNVAYFGDAWTWDGKAWSRIDKDPQPRGRGTAAATWNPVDSSLFVFGGTGLKASAGSGAQGEPLGDAWSLTGAVWTQLKGSGPPALAFANAIWDAGRKRVVVLLGMPCPKPSDAAWAWDGQAWSKLLTPGISARWGAASAQDPDGKAVLFGGSNESGC